MRFELQVQGRRQITQRRLLRLWWPHCAANCPKGGGFAFAIVSRVDRSSTWQNKTHRYNQFLYFHGTTHIKHMFLLIESGGIKHEELDNTYCRIGDTE